MSDNKNKTVLLFDVDGTLTEPRKKITNDMKELLQKLRKTYNLGIVGGSDLDKIKEQLGETIFIEYDYVFSENGLVAYENGKLIEIRSIKEYLGISRIKEFTKFCLSYISNLDIPVMTGTFIELRRGMINISPIGRNCTQLERDEFEVYDKQMKVRDKMINTLKEKFADYELKYSIGGQISFDVFPVNWDKTYCLKFLEGHNILFFGDKTYVGGNDHEIYTDPRVTGHSVKTYKDTMELLKKLIL